MSVVVVLVKLLVVVQMEQTDQIQSFQQLHQLLEVAVVLIEVNKVVTAALVVEAEQEQDLLLAQQAAEVVTLHL